MKSTKRSLALSVLSFMLCVAMLIGTTFAWFTDSVTSGKNRITAGNLDIELKHYTDSAANASSVQDATDLFDVDLWEPGVVVYENFVVSNEGTLALKYDLNMNMYDFNTVVVDGVSHNLGEVLKVCILDSAFSGSREDAMNLSFNSTLEDFVKSGSLTPKGEDGSTATFAVVVYWQPSDSDNLYNVNNGKTTSDGEPLYVELGVNLTATQKDYEADSFDITYDETAKTHEHAYTVQPSGLWKCDKCASFVTDTNAPYIMITDKTTLTEDDLNGDNKVTLVSMKDENATALAALGFTIIHTNSKTTYTYKNNGTARTVYIRQNGGDLVIDAPNDTVQRFGKAEDVYVLYVAGHSLVENGTVDDIVVLGSGNIEVSDKAVVNDLSVAKYADAANVKITLDSTGDNVGTIAVYNDQKSITVTKNANSDIATDTTPEAMQQSGEAVAIINDEAARVGTTLYNTVDEAIDAAAAKGEKEAARIVNDQTLAEPAVVPADTVLKVSAFTQVNITDDKGVDLQGTATLVNVGTIINTQETASAPTGLSADASSEIVNYGGFFDSLHESDTSVPDGGIFNKDGQTIDNDGTITNIGNIENSGKIVNDGDVTNSGNITNKTEDAEIENKGTVTNNGELENNGSIVNDGENAELNLQNGDTKGTGDIENKNGAQTVEENSGKAARIGSTYYTTLKDAIDAVSDGKTVKLVADANGALSINGKNNITVDLAGNYAINGSITLYNCDNVTIKNGSVNGQIRIGEHKYTKIKWKHLNYVEDYEPVYGYQPLEPATNIKLEGLTVTPPSGQPALYYTNIEDDLTRGAPTNYCDNNLYGHYVYKTGYENADQYIYNKKDEVFTAINTTDTVAIIGGTYNGKSIGNFTSYDDKVINGILTVSGGASFSDALVGRYMADGNYLVGDVAGNFVATTTQPTTFTGNVCNAYFKYVGGANDAISMARIGEEVTIGENADSKKEIGQDEVFTVISTDSNYKWTGASVSTKVEKPSNFEVIETVDENNANKRIYTIKFILVVRAYLTGNTGLTPTSTTPYKDYGSLIEAFNNAPHRGYLKLMRDVTINESQYLQNYSKYGVYMGNQFVFDLNGHTYTYNGEGTAILCTANYGSDAGRRKIVDSSAEKTGTIHATKGTAFLKKNKNTDMFAIEGGHFISDTTYAINIDGAKTFEIKGGTFESKKTNAVYLGSNVVNLTVSGGKFISPSGNLDITYGWSTGACTINGGTFSSDLSGLSKKPKITIASGKSAVDNGNGTWTVK